MNNKKSRNILSSNVQEIKQLIKSGSVSVCVIGIGRIGLPTALSFARLGLPTVGVDINVNLVSMINSGNYPLKDEPGFDKIFDEVIKNKMLHVTTNNAETIQTSDLVVLSLPTPMGENNIPDYSAIISVGKDLNKLLEPGSLIIVESTVEPGFIENEFIPIVEGDGKRLKVGKDFGIAACPETANPGQILRDFSVVPRLVGAFDERTTSIVSEIYNHVFKAEIIRLPDCKTANAAKLTANVFRDVNIAFVNELAILFERLGIDILKVLEACGQKYNFEIHYPGAGVGGPCLPVNSYQLLNSGKILNDNLKMIRTAREINEKMPHHVVELLIDALGEAKKPVSSSTIAILGISYKPNVKDIQLTPAEDIIKRLEVLNAKIKIYDPYFKSTEVFSHRTESNLLDAITGADATMIITAHDEFSEISPSLLVSKMKTPILIDSRGLIDPWIAKKTGMIFRGIGRGNV